MRPIVQLLHFGYHQAMSCIFPVVIFGTLALTTVIEIPVLHRYDAVLAVLLLAQYLMYRSGLETLDEIKVIWLSGWRWSCIKYIWDRGLIRSRAIPNGSAYRSTAGLCTQASPALCVKSGGDCGWI